MFSPHQLNLFLALKYSDLYQAVGTWDVEASKGVIVEDSFPPNFHSLVQAALAREHKRTEAKDSVAKNEKKAASKNPAEG